MTITGVYKITQRSTGKVYVGSSVDIEKRIKSHFSMLTKNKHYNAKLQEAYNTGESDDFKYEVLTECTIKEMMLCENFWITELNAVDSGFNLMRFSGNTGGTSNPTLLKKRKDKQVLEDSINCFIDLMRHLSSYKDITLNQNTFVGFHKLNLGLDNPKRLLKAGLLVNKLLSEVYSLPEGYYKISHVHFTGKEGSYMVREAEQVSYFAKKKTSNDIYDEVVSEIISTLECSTLGRKVTKRLISSGIVLERNEIEKEIS